jgi:hypothetical protein
MNKIISAKSIGNCIEVEVHIDNTLPNNISNFELYINTICDLRIPYYILSKENLKYNIKQGSRCARRMFG